MAIGPQARNNRLRLGIIGLGKRTTHMAQLVCGEDPEVDLVAIADPDPDVKSRASVANLRGAPTAIAYSSVEAMLDSGQQFDALMIGTRCHLHASLAVAVADLNLPVFLEKPIAISWEQLAALKAAYAGRDASVVVSFPLRLTQHVQAALEIIRSGRLGTINQIQAINNVPYGAVYFGQWYRDYSLTGGLWLQKATHDLDYINCLMAAAHRGAAPVSITAMHGRTVYGGKMPPDLRCSQCDRTEVCPESPQNLLIRGNDGGVLNHTAPKPDSDHLCTFSSSILHQDAGSALVMYSSGAHVSYSQNFLPRFSAGQRGATIIGYDATLRFDWQGDTITVIEHHTSRIDRIQLTATGMHGGGDLALAKNFVDVIRGKDASASPLSDGLLSTAMCLSAREAAATGIAQTIAAPANPAAKRLSRSGNGLEAIGPRGSVEPLSATESILHPPATAPASIR